MQTGHQQAAEDQILETFIVNPNQMSLIKNPFSESFGRPSGVPADMQSSKDAHAADESLPRASEVPDQNPFAAFMSPRPGSFAPPPVQLPAEPSAAPPESSSRQRDKASSSHLHQADAVSELGGIPGAAIVLDCSLRGIEVRVPYDQDPGAAIRFTELWAKAFQQVRQHRLPFLLV